MAGVLVEGRSNHFFSRAVGAQLKANCPVLDISQLSRTGPDATTQDSLYKESVFFTLFTVTCSQIFNEILNFDCGPQEAVVDLKSQSELSLNSD